MVDEHAHQLSADGAMQERCDHGGVDAARESEQNLALADLLAHPRARIFDDVAGAPQRIGAADLAHEALYQPCSLRGVRDLRVELHAVETPPLIAHRGEGNRGGRGRDRKAARQGIDPVAMAHPHVEHRAPVGIAPVLELIEQARGSGYPHLGVAELPLARARHAPAELLRHGLHAVADAEHRNPEVEHRAGRPRRARLGHRLGAAGQDHPARREAAHPGIAHVPRVDLAVHPDLAHAPCDELRVLRAEVEDQDALRMNVRLHRVRTPGSWVLPW